MNLQSAAESEKERRTRSRLEPHREAIFTLRRKHWTYRQIAKWLNEEGYRTRTGRGRWTHEMVGRELWSGWLKWHKNLTQVRPNFPI